MVPRACISCERRASLGKSAETVTPEWILRAKGSLLLEYCHVPKYRNGASFVSSPPTNPIGRTFILCRFFSFRFIISHRLHLTPDLPRPLTAYRPLAFRENPQGPSWRRKKYDVAMSKFPKDAEGQFSCGVGQLSCHESSFLFREGSTTVLYPF